MGMYQRILVATDGSEFSEEAVKKALALAKENSGTKVTAVCVAYTLRQWAFKNAIKEEAQKTLAQAKELADREGISLRIRLEEGYPFEKIVDVAKELNSDLIIMGSRGHTGIRKILLGSVTERVIGNAPCAVLVVTKEDGCRKSCANRAEFDQALAK
jgi:nucleotide-binding universal stress UspA family protein